MHLSSYVRPFFLISIGMHWKGNLVHFTRSHSKLFCSMLKQVFLNIRLMPSKKTRISSN